MDLGLGLRSESHVAAVNMGSAVNPEDPCTYIGLGFRV